MRLIRYTYPQTRIAPASLFTRSPWAGLETEIDRFFNSALTDFTGPNHTEPRFAVDLYEDDANAYVRAELPGVKLDAINVEVVDGYLNLAATREDGTAEQPATTRFSRSVALPEDVTPDRVKATYADGVLTVTLPKKEAAKPRKVTVQVS